MSTTDSKDFQEIAHSGGRVTIRVGKNAQGQDGYQLQWEHCRPNFASMFAVYALPPGVIVCQLKLRGIGSPLDPAPIPGCVEVFIGSDSEGKFGHECPSCGEYWRGDCGGIVCPYCGHHASMDHFVTRAQRLYVQQFCRRLEQALATGHGEHVIDMDAVADAVGKDSPRPPFYYSEQRQQNSYTCGACGSFNDILGRFGYCAVCGTRNTLQELSEKIIPEIRSRINAGGQYETCAKDAVAAFDTVTGDYVSELVRRVPLTSGRRNRLSNRRFHNLETAAEDLKEIFDIDLLSGLNDGEREFAKRMFHRRHVYEHLGAEADEKYIADSGDVSVRPKQVLRETQESAHRITSLVSQMINNLHKAFHGLLPVQEEPTKRYANNKRLVEQESLARRGRTV